MLSSEKLISEHLEDVITIFNDMLSADNKTLSHFMTQINNVARELDQDDANCKKGDLFEIFSELFFTIYNCDPRFGIDQYKCIEKADDYGVDAMGINVNGDKCVVQVKYRSNPSSLITFTDIAKTYAYGSHVLKYDLSKKGTIVLMTSSTGINAQCNKIFGKDLIIIGYNEIKYQVNNNKNFWIKCTDLLDKTISKIIGGK